MSINSAMNAGVAGLQANSTALAILSDNIANVNTVGYKQKMSDFATIVTANQSANAHSAGGVIPIKRALVDEQGLLQGTASSTDLGISGDGFLPGGPRRVSYSPAPGRSRPMIKASYAILQAIICGGGQCRRQGS